jgi:hypothetical protein
MFHSGPAEELVCRGQRGTNCSLLTGNVAAFALGCCSFAVMEDSNPRSDDLPHCPLGVDKCAPTYLVSSFVLMPAAVRSTRQPLFFGFYVSTLHSKALARSPLSLAPCASS